MPRRTKKEKALAKLASTLLTRALAARYDALKPSPTRKAVEIRTDLTETEQQYTAEKRVLAIAKSDDLYDNSPMSSILEKAVQLTIGQRGGTPVFTGADRVEMQAWFNKYKKHAGYEEGQSWYEMLALILRLVKLHGDVLIWVDPVLTGGKIRLFDADQIVSVNVPDFERWKAEKGLPEDCRQCEGVVLDGTNKVYGYWVTMLRNRYSVNLEDAMFLPIDTCRRVAYYRKHTQFRGEPAAFLTNEELNSDTKELLKSEIASAKLNSEYGLVVEQPEGMSSDEISSLLEGYENLDELAEGTGIEPEQLGMLGKTHEDKTFSAFEGHSAIATVANGTKITSLNNNQRPSPQIQSFIDLLADRNGMSMGMMSCLSRGRADNSYSSGQIEIEVSWKQFEEDQKLLERNVVDYVMETLYPNAEYEVYWDRAITIDPEKSEKTYDMQLRGGRTTFRDILGTDWRQIIDELAEEKEYLKSKGLDNLTFFQTSSGQELSEVQSEHLDKNDNNTENTQENDDEETNA